MDEQQKLIHLLNRATFGVNIDSLPNYLDKPRSEVVDMLFDESRSFKPFELASIKDFKFVRTEFDRQKYRAHRKQQSTVKKYLMRKFVINAMTTESQLREKMVFFWHDHFACNVPNPIKVQKQINTIRENALEYFGDLLVAISKDPGMNQYLNLQLNVKKRPNEDFGREILELFTLGEGNYSEKDILEAAKAFTGYGYDGKGNFYLYNDLHDNGVKEFMGKKGKFNGDDIIDIILENKLCGRYITSKIYKFFTGQNISEARLSELSNVFYNSGYHITTLLKAIFNADWFYEKPVLGARIKSPVELIISIGRLLKMKVIKVAYLYNLQKKLDQVVFEPPNVSGWIDGKSWIHFSTITERLSLAHYLITDRPRKILKYPEKISDEGDSPKFYRRVKSSVKMGLQDLKNYLTENHLNNEVIQLSKLIFPNDVQHISKFLEQTQKKYNSKKIDFDQVVIQLLSLPEFQIT